MPSIIDALAEEGYNTLRIPLALEGLIDTETSKTTGRILNSIFDYAAEKGILVMLSIETLRFQPLIDEASAASPIWFDDNYTEVDFRNGWERVLKTFANKWNFFAIEILSQPTSPAIWEPDNGEDTEAGQYNYRTFVTSFVQYISVNVPEYKGLFAVSALNEDNLAPMNKFPLTLSPKKLMERIVYSVHMLAPATGNTRYALPADSDSTRAPAGDDNLKRLSAIWDKRFGDFISDPEQDQALSSKHLKSSLQKNANLYSKAVPK